VDPNEVLLTGIGAENGIGAMAAGVVRARFSECDIAPTRVTKQTNTYPTPTSFSTDDTIN
jgi:hypothetical protein